MSQLLEQLLCHSTLNANNNTNTLTTSWQEHFYLYCAKIKIFFFINEIPGVLLHENIVKITCYPHTPVLEKITVALAT